jgi:hypothetical protein
LNLKLVHVEGRRLHYEGLYPTLHADLNERIHFCCNCY